MKNIFTFCFLSSLLFSCEKKINVDINDAEPKLVISGYISNFNEAHEIKVSKSGGINQTDFDFVSNAQITIEDNTGNLYQLSHDSAGIYKSIPFQAVEGNTYTLSVSYENQVYEAVTTMPPVVQLNKIDFQEQSFSFDTIRKVIYYYWTDPSTEGNYYRYFDRRFGDKEYVQPPSEYLLYDDRFSNGNNIIAESYEIYISDETIIAYLISLDEDVYTYYEQLRDITGSGPGGQGIPYNPKSNFNSNEVLGYFGAWAIDTLQIYIQ